MASLGWFHDELTLSDAAKLEYVDNTAKRVCQLALLLDHEDALDDGDPADYSRINTGPSTFDYTSGYLNFTASAAGDGLVSDTQFAADTPYRFEIEIQAKNNDNEPAVGCNHLQSISKGSDLMHISSRNAIGRLFPAKNGDVFNDMYCADGDEWTSIKIDRGHTQLGLTTLKTLSGTFDGQQIQCNTTINGDGSVAFYVMLGASRTGWQGWLRNLKLYLGYDTGGEDGSVVKDAGAGETWDGSVLATLAGSLALPDGFDYTNITFDYSYDDGSASWDTANTLAQLKTHMEAINTDKRYFRLKGNLNSDGDTQALMMLPNMPEVPLVASGGGGRVPRARRHNV